MLLVHAPIHPHMHIRHVLAIFVGGHICRTCMFHFYVEYSIPQLRPLQLLQRVITSTMGKLLWLHTCLLFCAWDSHSKRPVPIHYLYLD